MGTRGGVSDHINFEDAERGDLPGAENDALAMRDVLIARCGFAPEDVRLLLNQDAADVPPGSHHRAGRARK